MKYAMIGGAVLVAGAFILGSRKPPPKQVVPAKLEIILDLTGSTGSSYGAMMDHLRSLLSGLTYGLSVRVLALDVDSHLRPILDYSVDSKRETNPDLNPDARLSAIRQEADRLIRAACPDAERSANTRCHDGRSCIFTTIREKVIEAGGSGRTNILVLTDGQEDCEFETVKAGQRERFDLNKFTSPGEAVRRHEELAGGKLTSRGDNGVKVRVFLNEPVLQATRRQRTTDFLRLFWTERIKQLSEPLPFEISTEAPPDAWF